MAYCTAVKATKRYQESSAIHSHLQVHVRDRQVQKQPIDEAGEEKNKTSDEERVSIITKSNKKRNLDEKEHGNLDKGWENTGQ